MSNEKEFDALDIPEEEHKKTVQALNRKLWQIAAVITQKQNQAQTLPNENVDWSIIEEEWFDFLESELSEFLKPHNYLPPIKSADSFANFAKPPTVKSADSLGFGSATMSYESFGFDFFVKGNETRIDECVSDLLKEIKEYIIKNYDTKAVGLFQVEVFFHKKDSSIFYFPTTHFFLASDGTLIGYS